MSFAEIGLLICVLVLFIVSLLFRFELKRGSRVGEHFRAKTDFVVLEVTHKIHTITQVLLGQALRQIAHYFFHSFLAIILWFIEVVEGGVRNMIRTNKTFAKTAERQRSERNQLEEVALHKLEVALTEEEKKIHKENSLQGS